MSKPLADYVQLPKLDEYKEWFKDFADLYRETVFSRSPGKL